MSSSPLRVAFVVVDDRFSTPSPQPVFGTAPTALLQGFAHLAGEVEIHVICCTLNQAVSPTQLGPNIFYHSLPVGKSGFLRTLHSGCVRAVNRKLREIRPDIVHAQGTERWCAVSGIFNALPKVLTIHGNLRLINRVSPMSPRLYWKLQELMEVFAVPKYDGVVCITDYTRSNILDLARQTWVVPNAVDESFFEVIPQPRPAPEILYVGNVQTRKNQVAFIDAMRPLAQKTGLKVKFFGRAARGNPYDDLFFSRIDELPWCSYGGMLGRTELREQFFTASALALTSLEDNCPMTVLEAMAASVPIVASRVGGIPELVEHEVTGLLCEPTDPGSITAAMERLLGSPEATGIRTVKAREVATQRFHPQVIASSHLEVYREVIAAK